MNRLIIFIALSLCGGSIFAGERDADINDLEGQYVRCIESELNKNCLDVLSGHFVPWGDRSKDVEALRGFLAKWMNGIGVYKVHKAGLFEIEGLLQKRFYLIELDDGALAVFNVRYRSVKGRWNVLDIESSTNKDVIDEALGGKASPLR